MFPAIPLRAAAAALALALPLAVQSGAPVQAQSTAPAKDPVVATVNGEKVMLSDLRALHADLPEQIRKIPLDQIYQPLLEQVVQIKLLAAKARADGLDKSPPIERRLRALTDRVLQQAYLEDHIDKAVTEDQLAKAYKEFAAGHRGEEEAKARHILVKTKKEAMAVIEALEKGGKFAELARKTSIGPSKAGGGDLGWFARGQMVKPFADAAFALKKGRVYRRSGEDPVRLARHPARRPPPQAAAAVRGEAGRAQGGTGPEAGGCGDRTAAKIGQRRPIRPGRKAA